jgi:hypothetical protein
MNIMGLKSITTKGKQSEPPFFLIHGLGGVGKSSLGASIPTAFFFDTESSTTGLEVERCSPGTFSELLAYLDMFSVEEHGYRVAVLDTLDWAEKKAVSEVCIEMRIQDPNQVDYGKAWAAVNGKMSKLLEKLMEIHSKGYGVIVLAHSSIVNFRNPLGDDYDIYRIKCRDKTSALFLERPQLVGYMHKQILTSVDKKAGGFTPKIKTTTVQSSVLSCYPNAAYDSKNRFGIESDIIIPKTGGWSAIRHAVQGASSTDQ